MANAQYTRDVPEWDGSLNPFDDQRLDAPTQARGIFPEFEIRPMIDKDATEERGRPIYKDVEWITLYIAGDNKNIISRKLSDYDRRRFRDQYRAWQSEQEVPEHGTPLEEWPALSASIIRELKHLHIKTVEALADLNDGQLQNLGPGAFKLRAQAQAFLEASEDTAAAQKLAIRNQELQDTISAMQAQIEQIQGHADKNENLTKENLELRQQLLEVNERVSALTAPAKTIQKQKVKAKRDDATDDSAKRVR